MNSPPFTIIDAVSGELFDDTILFHIETFTGGICPPFGQLALLVESRPAESKA